MAYDICRYTPRFRSQVLELQRHLWGPDRSANERYLAWKYERNPYLTDPLIFLALQSDRVVGMRGAYGTKWHVGAPGKSLGALCLGDGVVEPDHRRRGLLQAMNEALAEAARKKGLSFIVNTSSGRVTREAALKRGWRETEEVRPMARAGRSLRRRLGLGRRHPEGASLAELDRRTNRAGSRISMSAVPRPRAMAELVERAALRGSIRERRDVAFYEWRFGNPLGDYRFVYRESDAGPETIDGYLVVQSHGARHDTGINLVDWEVAAPATLSALLAALRPLLGSERVTTWPGADDPELDRVFRRAGFEPVPPPPPPWVVPRLLILPLEGSADEAWSPGGVDMLKLESWHLRMTVSDFY